MTHKKSNSSKNQKPIKERYQKGPNQKNSGGTRNPSTTDAPKLTQTKPPKKD